MKEQLIPFGMPLSILIAAFAFALLTGADAWMLAKGVLIVVPIGAYVVFAIFTVFWAIKMGEVGLKQEMTFQAKLYFWHGVSVILTIILSAAGSFIVFFALQMRGLLSGDAG